MSVVVANSLVDAHEELSDGKSNAAVYPTIGWDGDDSKSIVLFRNSNIRDKALSFLPDAEKGCMLRWPSIRTSADPKTVIEMLTEEQAVA